MGINVKKIIQKIKDFELINNGIDEAFIDVFDIEKTAEGVVCSISVYDDDFSSENIYKSVVYPQILFTNL